MNHSIKYPGKSAVVLFSGGLDSTVCLASAVKAFGAENVTALTIFYGQKHDKELESAKAVAEYYKVNHLVKDLSEVFTFSDCPLLQNSKDEIPVGDYAKQKAAGTVATYVPFRNGLFLSYATAIAYSINADVVYYGAHADDAAGDAYPDCTPMFKSAMAQAIKRGTGEKVRLASPYIYGNKADIVRLGLELDVPFHLTWSCYNGREKHCGICSTCLDRLKAFKLNDAEDPVPYELDVPND